MFKRLFRPAALAGALAVAATGVVVSVSPAQAAVVGPAKLTVAASGIDQLLFIDSSGPCAAPATRVRAIAKGFGFPANGQVVVPQTAVGFSTTDSMHLPLSNSFRVYATNNASTALVGDYQVLIQCVNSFGTTVYDEYETTMTWTTPGNSFANIDDAIYTSTVATPSNTVLPVTSNSTAVGGQTNCSTGTWSNSFGTGTTYTYEWLKGGTPIVGETANNRINEVADFGAQISCRVTAINGPTQTAVATSAAYTVTKGTFTNSFAPSIYGPAKVGYTLQSEDGTWSPTPTSFSYQWLRNGAAIAGARSYSYKAVAVDAGKTISLRVTANAAGVNSLSTVTNARKIAFGTIVAKAAPKVTGKAKVGKKLTASKGSWNPAPTSYSYQWLRNGKAISKATKTTYKLTKKDKGKKISVKVTVKKAGYTTVTKVSKSTSKVKKK